MLRSLGGWRPGSAVLGIAICAAAVGCANGPSRLFQRPGPIECERFLAAAQAALTASADSMGLPAAPAHAAAMHEYHACRASPDAASDARRPSRAAP